MISDKELNVILKRWSLTTADEWRSCIEGRDHTSGSNFIRTIIDGVEGPDIEIFGGTSDDQEFIAHCKQDVPALVQEIKILHERIKALRN